MAREWSALNFPKFFHMPRLKGIENWQKFYFLLECQHHLALREKTKTITELEILVRKRNSFVNIHQIIHLTDRKSSMKKSRKSAFILFRLSNVLESKNRKPNLL